MYQDASKSLHIQMLSPGRARILQEKDANKQGKKVNSVVSHTRKKKASTKKNPKMSLTSHGMERLFGQLGSVLSQLLVHPQLACWQKRLWWCVSTVQQF